MASARSGRHEVWRKTSDEQWRRILPSVTKANRRSVRVVSVAFSLMMLICILISNFSSKMSNALPLYVVSLGCSIAMYAMASKVDDGDERAVSVLTYVTISGLLVYSTILGTLFNSDQMAASFPAFVLASPLLFMDKRRRLVTCIGIHALFFLCMALAFDNPRFVVDDVTNSCLFSAVSVGINSYLLNVKLNHEYVQARLSELTWIDLLTGVRNRNSYERALAGLASSCKLSLTCVFADLNGLHELNEESGHSVGDERLKCVAAMLSSAFGGDDTYRIGGDEFVSFCRDLDAAAVTAKVAAVRAETEAAHCHVSLGVSTAKAPGIDVDELVKLAERQMYEDKRRYYERTGFDRRGRRS
ncbi:MAG: GGDEF domain-containing protein [Olsenella sp.]|nr:GGDEF domain-containing protein [Olsenella sp.]